MLLLEQCLPFTVLKLLDYGLQIGLYGKSWNSAYRLQYWNALIIVLVNGSITVALEQCLPFTVLKLKGVSPFLYDKLGWNSAYRLRYWNLESDYDKVKHLGELEQCLPFTVLKRLVAPPSIFVDSELEQCLPFTVLKLVTLSVVLVLSELEQCLPFTVLKRIKHRH